MRFSRDRLVDVLAVLACAYALSVGLAVVRGLAWPYDSDHFRDIAQAQVTRDGHPLGDPHYRGESVWYNPLVPWIVAGGSALTRTTPSAFHVQGAPWLNLIAPIGFYVFAAALIGRFGALAGLLIFLFVNGRSEPSLTVPTYSPWLFVATFAQGLFFLSAAALIRVAKHQSDRGAALIGFLAGLTFLAHTAPALILGIIALTLLDVRRLAIAGGVAVVIASPFLYSIIWRYRLHVVNDVPMAWEWLPTALGVLPETLQKNAAFIAVGLAGVLVVPSKVARIFLAVSVGLYALRLTGQAVPGLPAVPGFHFWRYTLAALTIFAGGALWWLCHTIGRRYDWAVFAVAVAALLFVFVPQYRGRFDFVYGRAVADNRPRQHDAFVTFLHKSTPADAVILGTRGESLQIIGPAGRHVVAVNANWSNPYLDNVVRVRDRDGMLQLLLTHDDKAFAQLADAYHVTHVVATHATECAAMQQPQLRLVYSFGEECLLERVSAY